MQHLVQLHYGPALGGIPHYLDSLPKPVGEFLSGLIVPKGRKLFFFSIIYLLGGCEPSSKAYIRPNPSMKVYEIDSEEQGYLYFICKLNSSSSNSHFLIFSAPILFRLSHFALACIILFLLHSSLLCAPSPCTNTHHTESFVQAINLYSFRYLFSMFQLMSANW